MTTLRKISASTFFQGLANTCSNVAKLAGAKTEKEKQEATCNVVTSVLQGTADVCKDQEENKRKKQENKKEQQEKIERSKQEQKTQGKKTQKETAETRSIDQGYAARYIQQLLELKTDQEKIELINKVLQDKEATEELIEEIVAEIKGILISALLEN